MEYLLSVILLIPLAGLFVLFFLPSSNAKLIKLWANGVMLVGFIATLPLLTRFDYRLDMQFVEKQPWIPSIGASWNLGADGYAVLLIVLTGLVGFLSVLCS